MAETMTQKENKGNQIEQILKNIEDGILELVECDNPSPAWKIFSKIKNVETKIYVDYVQCNKCKVVRSYTKSSGTSTLNKHVCKTKKGTGDHLNADFKAVPTEMVNELKQLMIKQSIEFCAKDVVMQDTLCGAGFVRFAQNLVLIGDQNGMIDVENILPSKETLTRHVKNYVDEEQIKTEQIFKEALKKGWCSATANISYTTQNKSTWIVSTTYFDDELSTLTKKVMFTVDVSEQTTPERIIAKIQNKLFGYGCSHRSLKDLHVITPKIKSFEETFGVICSRIDCVALTINLILKDSFGKSNGEVKDVFVKCNQIVEYFIATEQTTKTKLGIVEYIGTWKSRVEMIRSINSQYADVIKSFNDDERKQFKYNQDIAEELLEVLQPFVDAIEDLQSKTYPTLNKVLLWRTLLGEHLKKGCEYSIEIKQIMSKAISVMTNNFAPTMEHKIATFLDPRYRWLKVLSVDERISVVEEVRRLLEDIPIEKVTQDQTVDVQPKKKSRFSRFEANDDNIEGHDEVDAYIHRSQINMCKFEEAEFSIIAQFWKSNKTTLPKLFKLATKILHIPACCCDGVNNIKTKIDCMDVTSDLLFIRDGLANSK